MKAYSTSELEILSTEEVFELVKNGQMSKDDFEWWVAMERYEAQLNSDVDY